MKGWFFQLAFSCLFMSTVALAADAGGITIGGTRVIYEGGKKESSLSITNSSANPYLIQSWIESLTGGAGKPPFVITPPLFRLEGNQQNVLRILRTGGDLPGDRESMFWINVKSIPSSEKAQAQNTLQIAVKTSIKLIYRPQGLKAPTDAISNQLVWSLQGNRLTVNNPTPYYVNFNQVKVGEHEVKDVTFVAPKSSATFTAPTGVAGTVSWKAINDYGGVTKENISVR